MDEKYLTPTSGGKWVISRMVEGGWVSLHQDNGLFDPGDAVKILSALGVPLTAADLDQYFPVRKGHGRCPTLELLELCNVLDFTNPFFRKRGSEAGV